MWTQDTMTFLQSLALSGMGMFVVMSELALLAVAIIIFSKLLTFMEKRTAHKHLVAAEVSITDSEEEEACAVVIAAVCEEVGIPHDKIRVTQIREIT